MQEQCTIARPVVYMAIEGFPGYRVGDDGSVWSCWRRGRPAGLTETWIKMKPSAQYRGHMCVCLVCDGKKHYRFVHRLVLEAFVGPCPDGMECCHGPDPDPSNNSLDNLRWDTRMANCRDSVKDGSAYLGKSRKGEENPSSKLTKELVAEIMYERTRYGIGAKAICLEVGLPETMRGAVEGVIRGASWNHVTGLPPYKPKSHRVGRPPKSSTN